MKIWWGFFLGSGRKVVFSLTLVAPHGELEGAAVRSVRWVAEAPETLRARVGHLRHNPELVEVAG